MFCFGYKSHNPTLIAIKFDADKHKVNVEYKSLSNLIASHMFIYRIYGENLTDRLEVECAIKFLRGSNCCICLWTPNYLHLKSVDYKECATRKRHKRTNDKLTMSRY